MARPVILVLSITNRCTATCTHCATCSSPRDSNRLSLEEMLDYIGAAADAPQGLSWIGITGGEPFVCFDDLNGVLRCARDRQIPTRCATNCYWATSTAEARTKTGRVKESGLGRLIISYDTFHGEFVPIANIRRAVEACREQDLALGLKCVVTRDSMRVGGLLDELGDVLLDTEITVQEIPCMPAGRAADLPRDSLLLKDATPAEVCPAPDVIHICPSADTFPCCTPGWPPLLLLGNARSSSLPELIKRSREDTLLCLLREEGPARLLADLRDAGTDVASSRFVNTCHLCQEVLGAANADPAVLSVLEGAVQRWGEEKRIKGERLARAIETILSPTAGGS